MIYFKCGHKFKDPIVRIKDNKTTYECKECHKERNRLWAMEHIRRKGKWKWKKLV